MQWQMGSAGVGQLIAVWGGRIDDQNFVHLLSGNNFILARLAKFGDDEPIRVLRRTVRFVSYESRLRFASSAFELSHEPANSSEALHVLSVGGC